MTIKRLSLITSLLSCFFANVAHAEHQTWRLTATVYQLQSGFVPPAFASLGQTIVIDYLIDTLTPSDSGWLGMYSGAVKSISFDGQASQADGYIYAGGNGLNAINVWPILNRTDGVDFLSFNRFGGEAMSSVTAALNDFSAVSPSQSVDFRIDFGSNSVWANPTSFTMTAVPEPESYLMMLSGLVLVGSMARGRQRATV